MAEQLSLPEGDIIDRHDLIVQVDRPRRWPGPDGYFASFVGARGVDFNTEVQVVHVISPHRGGEIRGYVLIGDRLHLRLPCYTGHWDELDEAVARRTGASVVPYELGAGGMEVERG